MILAAVLLSAACTADTGDDGPEAAPACGSDLETGLSRWADAGFSGSIAIGGEEGFACLASFGLADNANGTPNTEATVFAIGSVSKAFTTAAIIDLADSGALGLDERAGDLLPGLGGPAAEATVEQLLLHTGGLSGSHGSDHEPLDRDEAVAAIGALASDFAPGTDYLYSNAGYTLLALIVDERSGTSYRDYMAEEILTLPSGERLGGFWDGEPAPIGPRAFGYETGGAVAAATGEFTGPHWALEGNGDLAMTAAELATWTRALFAGEIISPEAVATLRATGFEHGGGATELPGWVAVDAEAYGVPAVMSAGGGGDTGHHAVAAWLPETGGTIAVTSNTAEVTAEELLKAIGSALAAGEPIPVPEGHAEVDPAELAAREGAYVLDSGGTLTVAATDEGLEVAADGADAVAAMFTGDYSPAEVEAHEAAVLALLEGGSEAGREELEAAEDEFGPVTGIEAAGTVVEESELRTYVRFSGLEGTGLAWYALDGDTSVAGAWLGAGPPAFTLVPTGEGEYRQENLSGAGAGLRVVFDGDRMTVTGPGGTAEAVRRA